MTFTVQGNLIFLINDAMNLRCKSHKYDWAIKIIVNRDTSSPILPYLMKFRKQCSQASQRKLENIVYYLNPKETDLANIVMGKE